MTPTLSPTRGGARRAGALAAVAAAFFPIGPGVGRTLGAEAGPRPAVLVIEPRCSQLTGT